MGWPLSPCGIFQTSVLIRHGPRPFINPITRATPGATPMREVKSYCRFCMPFCGTRVTLDDNDRIISVKGDRDDLMTSGYICFKGVQAPASYDAADRVLHPLKR